VCHVTDAKGRPEGEERVHGGSCVGTHSTSAKSRSFRGVCDSKNTTTSLFGSRVCQGGREEGGGARTLNFFLAFCMKSFALVA
jgi:hypothetical protein